MRTVHEMTWEQRCAADAQARDWHLNYGRSEFYHSPKWGQLTAVADGTTTVTDVADALAAGTATPYQQALAASFWVDAAEYLAGRARGEVAHARRGHPHEGLTDDLGQVPWLVDDDELAAAEQRQAAADAALVAAGQIRDAAVEREDDTRRRQEAQDEAAYHEAEAQAARTVLVAEVAGPWRTAVDVEYDQICADYGNDGHPANDRHISARDKTAQRAAIEQIAQRTRLPSGAVWDAVREVSDRYARDHTDTATLDQPDWDLVRDNWHQKMAERQQYGAAGAPADNAATAEKTPGEAIAAAADLPTPDLPTPGPAAVIEADALAAEDAVIEASTGAAWGVERHAAERDHLTSPDPVLWGPVAAELLDELDQARAQLEAGDIPPERAHDLAQRIEHLEDQTARSAQTAAELGTTTDALLAELITELDTTGPDPYPGDHSPYWDHHDTPPATAPQQQPGDEPATPRLHGADADAWGAAEGTPVAELPASYHDGSLRAGSPGRHRAKRQPRSPCRRTCRRLAVSGPASRRTAHPPRTDRSPAPPVRTVATRQRDQAPVRTRSCGPATLSRASMPPGRPRPVGPVWRTPPPAPGPPRWSRRRSARGSRDGEHPRAAGHRAAGKTGHARLAPAAGIGVGRGSGGGPGRGGLHRARPV